MQGRGFGRVMRYCFGMSESLLLSTTAPWQLVDAVGALHIPGDASGTAHDILHAAVEGLQALAHAPVKCMLAAHAHAACDLAALHPAADAGGCPLCPPLDDFIPCTYKTFVFRISTSGSCSFLPVDLTL